MGLRLLKGTSNTETVYTESVSEVNSESKKNQPPQAEERNVTLEDGIAGIVYLLRRLPPRQAAAWMGSALLDLERLGSGFEVFTGGLPLEDRVDDPQDGWVSAARQRAGSRTVKPRPSSHSRVSGARPLTARAPCGPSAPR